MEFKINDKVKETVRGIAGFIEDKMFSEARGSYIYAVRTDEGVLLYRDAGEIEHLRNEYQIEAEIADNVVICIIYEIEGDLKTEVCRGHGHIIHEGAEGIAQALAYASKRALQSIDTGIYFKQNKGK